MYLLRSTETPSTEAAGGAGGGLRVQLLGSGTILREVEAAAGLLASDFGISADVWSCPSFTELGRDTIATDRWNLLHPEGERRTAWVTARLAARPAGPVVAATDYMRAFAEQIRPAVPADRRYVVLGTDGYGRSDYRTALRRHFEVDRQHVVVAALSALAADGAVPASTVAEAIERYGLDPDKAQPATA
jgi:pyruvate dehydrogenase E1 component